MTDRDARQSPRVPRFAREVGINVAGNVITAMIIYVLGALAGVFPRTVAFYVLAAVLLTATGALVLMVTSFFIKGRSGWFWTGVAALLTSPAGAVYTWHLWNRSDSPSTLMAVLWTAIAASAPVAGAWLLLGLRWPRFHPWWMRSESRPKIAEGDRSAVAVQQRSTAAGPASTG